MSELVFMVGSSVKGSLSGTIVGAVINKIGVNELKNTGSFIMTGTKTIAGYVQYGYGVLTKNLDTQFKGAIRTAVHSNRIDPSQLKGFAAGLVGAAVNVGIGIVADDKIRENKEEASGENKVANIKDSSNSINIVSIQL